MFDDLGSASTEPLPSFQAYSNQLIVLLRKWSYSGCSQAVITWHEMYHKIERKAISMLIQTRAV